MYVMTFLIRERFPFQDHLYLVQKVVPEKPNYDWKHHIEIVMHEYGTPESTQHTSETSASA